MTEPDHQGWIRVAGVAIAGSAFLSVVLAGCSASSLPFSNRLDEKISVPKGYVTNGTKLGGPDADWTKSFKDKELDRLIAKVLEANYDLQSAAARVKQAEAVRFTRFGERVLPQLDFNVDARRQQQAFIGFPFGGSGGGTSGGGSSPGSPSKSLANQFGVSFDIAWEADLWGRARAGEAAAIAEVEATKFDEMGLRVSLAAQTAKSWFALIEAYQQLELSRQSVKSFRDSAETIRDQFKLADQSGAQLRLSMADVATAEADLQQREETLKQVTRELEILLGRYPAAEIKAAKDLPSMPKAPPAGLPAELLYRRADLASAERRIASDFSEIREAKLALLPTIALTGSGGTLAEDVTNVLTLPEFGVWSIAAGASQAIIERGKTIGETRRRKAVRDEAVADYQNTALTAFKEVEDALTAEGTLRRRGIALEKADALLLEAYTRSQQEFRDGVGDVLTILAAQRQLLTTRSQLLTVRRVRLDNRVNLHLALGGGFDSRPLLEKKKDS